MHSLSPSRRHRDQWIFCLTAVADVVHRLPALYRVIEEGRDDVRIELHLDTGAFEVLLFREGGVDQIVASVGTRFDRPPALPLPEWMAAAADRLVADLQWAESRDCMDQGDEILAALVRFRGAMLTENGRRHARNLIDRARQRLTG